MNSRYPRRGEAFRTAAAYAGSVRSPGYAAVLCTSCDKLCREVAGTMTTACPHCSHRQPNVPDIMYGKELRCRECGERFVAPQFRTVEEYDLALRGRREAEQHVVAEREADRQRREAERQAQTEVERQRCLAANTGLGVCPQCGSRNIAQFSTGGADGSAQAATCCCGCMLLWPLMLLAPFLFRHPEQLHRRCIVCGFQWLV